MWFGESGMSNFQVEAGLVIIALFFVMLEMSG
jgi:hypothetical protein